MARQDGRDAADQNFDYMFKLLIIGNSSVGKTSFLFRYADDSFTSAFVSTVGIDFKVKTVFRHDKRVKLQIWVSISLPICIYSIRKIIVCHKSNMFLAIFIIGSWRTHYKCNNCFSPLTNRFQHCISITVYVNRIRRAKRDTERLRRPITEARWVSS